MNILGFIPARGGSKGIPRKNIIDLAGKPLIDYTYEAAEKSKYLTRIVLSTDSAEIAQTTVNHNRIEAIRRPDVLAQDNTTTADVIHYLLQQLKEEDYTPDYIVILQPTSPLRSAEDIDNCLQILLENAEIDSVVSVRAVPHNFIPEKLMKLESGLLYPIRNNMKEYTTRQSLPNYYARNGAAIYAFKTSVFLQTNSYYGTKCYPYIMEEERSVDIDTKYDLWLAEMILRYWNIQKEI